MSTAQTTTTPDTDLEQRIVERVLERLADEVRTRRLVVVDQYGNERVVADCPPYLSDDTASLKVQDPSGRHYAELVATSADNDDRFHFAEVTVALDDSIAASLGACPNASAPPEHNRSAELTLDNVVLLQRFWKA